jgi:hypothetical protein
MPLGAVVRLAEATVWRPSNGNGLPPAKGIPGTGRPRSSCGVWQWPQEAIVTRCSPRAAASANLGVGTGAVSGSGTALMNRLRGNGTSEGGRGRRTAGSVRRYAMIASRSSSGIRRKLS